MHRKTIPAKVSGLSIRSSAATAVPGTPQEILTRVREASPADTNFKTLLKNLAECVEHGSKTAKKFDAADYEVLEQVIRHGASIYATRQYLDHQAARSSFHELYKPLRRVIELLRHRGNYEGIMIALGAYPIEGHDPTTLKQAELRRESLLRDLENIYQRVPPPPEKRGKGKPSGTRDLQVLVKLLATYWEKATGRTFKQDWHKDGDSWLPATNAAAFVYAIVEFIDPSHLRSLKKVMEREVAQRRKLTFPK